MNREELLRKDEMNHLKYINESLKKDEEQFMKQQTIKSQVNLYISIYNRINI